MDENKLEQIFQLGALMELLNKCKELIQMNGLVGGHRSYSDEMLNYIMREVNDEIERLKEEIK